ncbi:FAD-dependent monooxygenase [Pseudomonas vancouverensis]|uniref:FAD-dependent monooxygenase n=1 Tax=Pseudomonas vancouverensis TaxID=95300 RepID=UPI003D07D2C9
MSNNEIDSKPVIVLGSGPVGLGAAIELGRCGIKTILIERNSRTSWHPKTRNFNSRTMEIARTWGPEIYEELRELDLPIHWKSPIRFMTAIVGKETGQIESKGFRGATPDISPVSSVLSSQDQIEPVLMQQVQRSGMVDVRFRHEMLEFLKGDEDSDEEVQIRVRDLETGNESIVVGSALVAADGAGSEMRQILEMPLEGPQKVANFINCYFHADVERYAAERPGILLFVANENASGVFQALDARGRWLCQISVPLEEWSTEIYNNERCTEWIRAGVGVPELEVDVKSVGKWQMNAAVCRELQRGRVVFVGDAAHMFPPTGGLGVNTGIQGMHNAMWKLALFLRGKASKRLLESYTLERKPVAKWVAEQSLHNHQQAVRMAMISLGATADITPEEVLTTARRYGNQLGLELGFVYESHLTTPDGTSAPTVSDPYTDYAPSARPGHRAPHVWLDQNGRKISTIDLARPEFSIFSGKEGHKWAGAVAELSRIHGLDIALYSIGTADLIDTEETFLNRYEINVDGAVLIRPDGYVAWRSQAHGSQEEIELGRALNSILN